MQRLTLIGATVFAFLSVVGAAVASGPPLANEKSHVIDQPFTEDAGFDCGTGLPTFITGVFTGVLHTIVKADGSVHFTGAVRGSLTEDDLPTDGQPDATETFVLILNDLVLPPGSEVDHASLNGDGVTTGGVPFRIHEVVQVVLDQNGDPKLTLSRLSCF
jgi:hypothetical protein